MPKKAAKKKSAKKPSGRPARVLTEYELKVIFDVLDSGGSITEAVKRIGMPRISFYAMMERLPDLKLLVAKARGKFPDLVRTTMMKLLRSNNPAMAIHCSKSILGNTEKKVIEGNLNIGELSDDDLKKRVLEILSQDKEDN